MVPRAVMKELPTVKRHPEYNEHAFCVAVETAFTQWEALQNVGSLGYTSGNTQQQRDTVKWLHARALFACYRPSRLTAGARGFLISASHFDFGGRSRLYCFARWTASFR